MYKIIQEGKAKIKVPKAYKISKELPVFYNPVMEFNRTVSVLLLKVIGKKMKIGLPLGGSGVRAVRFLKELPKSKIKEVWINDINKEAVKIIKENLRLNKVKAKVVNKDANMFLLESSGFDYIDIDPFGSPNIFLDSAVKRIGRGGVLAVTATDTGCLAGSYVKACKRKYWSNPVKNENMHENGLRILIRKVQLIGADHSKALIPIYSYFKDHYFRIFFRCEKGKQKVDVLLKKHGMLGKAGPLWLGELWDKKVAAGIAKLSDDKFLHTIDREAKIDAVGFYNIPWLVKKYKLKQLKQKDIINKIKKKHYKVAETHFACNSLRSDIDLKKMIKLF
ncbi:tRNA (guanine(10)-N(2))-dimethyltransferase [Candidatus Woesearchaeota archaeon]|nr:tRNA (guanine(10)-N(2))-dimethyltransferase [Candidatus Woesearchaeota archaeon]